LPIKEDIICDNSEGIISSYVIWHSYNLLMFSLEGSLRLTTIFIHYQDGKLTLLLVYGDDIIITCNWWG
jgi:hypothetical protein